MADAISAAVAAAAADVAAQGIDIAVTGQGSFDWSQVLTSGLTAVGGSDLVGDFDFGSLGAIVDASDDSLVGSLLDATITQGADSFVTNLAEGGSLSSALGQALQGGLESLAGNVADDLDNALVSSTFLQDTSSFLDQVSNVAADLPFADSALSFLNQALGGDWNGLPFASFAQSGASLLEQVASDNLGDTSFGDYVTSLLNQTIAGGLTGNSFAQGGCRSLRTRFRMDSRARPSCRAWERI